MKDNLPLNYGACHTFLQSVIAVADKYPLCQIGFSFTYLISPGLCGEGNGSFT